MDKFFNKKDIPWVTLVWEKHYSNDKLLSHIRKRIVLVERQPETFRVLKSFATVRIQNGGTCLSGQIIGTSNLCNSSSLSFTPLPLINLSQGKSFCIDTVFTSHIQFSSLGLGFSAVADCPDSRK
jgi:hypothetical protein